MEYLTYKGYTGSKVIDEESDVLRGKILFIDDLVTYEGERPSELRAAFEASVDDYIATCATIGKEPQRPYTGSFNVRVTPELHKAAAQRAVKDGVKLNRVVFCALEKYVLEPQQDSWVQQDDAASHVIEWRAASHAFATHLFHPLARVTTGGAQQDYLQFLNVADLRVGVTAAPSLYEAHAIESKAELDHVTAH